MPPPTKIKRPPPPPPRKKNFVDRSPPRPAPAPVPAVAPTRRLTHHPSSQTHASHGGVIGASGLLQARRRRRVHVQGETDAAACSDRVIFNSSPRARINIYRYGGGAHVTSAVCRSRCSTAVYNNVSVFNIMTKSGRFVLYCNIFTKLYIVILCLS